MTSLPTKSQWANRIINLEYSRDKFTALSCTESIKSMPPASLDRALCGRRGWNHHASLLFIWWYSQHCFKNGIKRRGSVYADNTFSRKGGVLFVKSTHLISSLSLSLSAFPNYGRLPDRYGVRSNVCVLAVLVSFSIDLTAVGYSLLSFAFIVSTSHYFETE